MSGLLASTAQVAHAAAASLLSKPVSPGASIPTSSNGKKITVKETDPEKGFELGAKDGAGSGKVVIIGVPGAFTPPCSSQVPGYIERAQEFIARGVKGIYVVAVNDTFVMQAWKEKLTGGKDTHDTGEFTSALGMLFDATGLLGAPRSKRYVIIAEDGVITHVAVEEAPPEVTVTRADVILAQL